MGWIIVLGAVAAGAWWLRKKSSKPVAVVRPALPVYEDYEDEVEREPIEQLNPHELSKRYDGDGPDEPFRQIAREEASKRFEVYLEPLVFLGLLVGAIHLYGATAGWLVGSIAVAWFLWSVVKMDWDSAHERHLIVMKAEDLNRLRVITDVHAAGEPVWRIHEKEYERDTNKIETVDGPRWEGSWKRIYHDALQLQTLSPRKRRAKLEKAAQAARSALLDGEAMAKRENAELTFWASGHLPKLEHS